MAQQSTRARNYCAHHNTRDHWTLRCMNRCPDLVVCLKRDLQCLRPEASLVLIYRHNVAGMEVRVDLAQPVNRTPDLWWGGTRHYHSILFVRPDSRLRRKPKQWSKGGRWKKKDERKSSFGRRNEIEERKMACGRIDEHGQEERKMSMKAEEQKYLQEVSAENEMFEEKEETSGDVIKDKDDLNPVILCKERIDFDDAEIEEEKPKLSKRKLTNLSRMTVAELQQKVNLKASSNIILIPLHRIFKCEYSQDKGGMEKIAWKLPDFIKRIGIMEVRLHYEREKIKT
ncbi:hypothetical protein TNCV_4304881 [Trichonephila clavipes]|nr:hypothetical protein TNCV_4304881 [Trichonephila clavipes]